MIVQTKQVLKGIGKLTVALTVDTTLYSPGLSSLQIMNASLKLYNSNF